jgi:hypothetical protein
MTSSPARKSSNASTASGQTTKVWFGVRASHSWIFRAFISKQSALTRAADTVKATSTIADAVAAGELASSEAASLAKVIEIYIQAFGLPRPYGRA